MNSSSYKNHVKEWLKFSKTHGFDRLVISKNPFYKAFWLFSLLVSAGICSFLLGRIISDYLRFEVKTRIREVYSETVRFPMVSICNSNPFLTQAAQDYIRDYFKTNFNKSIDRFADFFDHQNESFRFEFELNYLFYLTNHPDFNSSLRESFGENFLVYCNFFSDDCKPDDIRLVYDQFKGNCLLINSDKFANGSKREVFQAFLPDSGLTLMMYTGLPEEEFDYLFFQNGIPRGHFVRIEDPDYNGILLGGLGIPPGTQAHISLTRKITRNMPQPYSNCVPIESINTRASRQMQLLGIEYSRKTCLIVCQQINIVQQLGCNNMQYPLISGYPLCKTKSEFLESMILDFNLSFCSDLCPIECESSTYEMSVSYTSWPTYGTYYWAVRNKILGPYFGTDNLSFDQVKKSMASAQIHFKEIKYTEITESPAMSFVDLVAAIGGMLGLFLGFSVMIIVELIELGIEFGYLFSTSAFKKLKSKIGPKSDINPVNES